MEPTVNNILKAFGGAAALGRAIGWETPAELNRCHLWNHRQKIPSQWFPDIVAAAKKEKIKGITFDVLHSLQDNRRA